MKETKIIILNDEKPAFSESKNGDAQMRVHQVFPGIELVYSSAHMDGCSPEVLSEGTVVKIQHCLEERIGKNLKDEFFCQMPGNLSVMVSDKDQKGYLKIKVMELLLALSKMDSLDPKASYGSVSQTQADLAKKITDYLNNRSDSDITVAELAKKFHVSKSHLQNTFRGVYGTSVFNYMRIRKMHSAALKLARTEKSVLEIANECGYENASKFAAAFREIMGELPGEYRKNHRSL